MKICTKCKVEKSKSDFSNRKDTVDGLSRECRACTSSRNAEYRSKNKDILLSYNKEYYISNIEKIALNAKEYRLKNKEKLKENNRIYRLDNSENLSIKRREKHIAGRDSANARSREYYALNKDKIAAQKSEYRSLNKEIIISHNRNARARRRNADGRHTASDVREIFSAQRGLCANCKCKLFKTGAKKYHVDHIMPLALGGSNDKGNLQCLCKDCNLKKNAKDPLDWARENGRLL